MCLWYNDRDFKCILCRKGVVCGTCSLGLMATHGRLQSAGRQVLHQVLLNSAECGNIWQEDAKSQNATDVFFYAAIRFSWILMLLRLSPGELIGIWCPCPLILLKPYVVSGRMLYLLQPDHARSAPPAIPEPFWAYRISPLELLFLCRVFSARCFSYLWLHMARRIMLDRFKKCLARLPTLANFGQLSTFWTLCLCASIFCCPGFA